MFEMFKPKPKEEEAPKGPTIEDLAMALPEDDRNELLKLKGLPEELGHDVEDGIEIDHDKLSETDEANLERYYALLQEAKELYEQRKDSGE
jgi:hypothetical protein